MQRRLRSTSPGRRAKAPVSLTWYGHSAFRLDTPGGKVILIDPWLENPKAPLRSADIDRADAILVTHGHSDHVGQTVEIARRTGARVFAIHEVSVFLQKAGVPDVVGMNKSGTAMLDEIAITMVDATHSGGIETGDDILPGGEPAGFMIRLETGLVVYHAGDTGVFGDMRLLAQLYKPDIALLPIGGLYTMGPREAAKACEFLRPRHVLGMHYGTFPPLAGTPGELKKFLPAPLKRRVHELIPGQALQLS